MICVDYQPISVVEDKGFVKFVSNLQPLYKLPSRRDLSSVLLPRLYENKKTELAEALKDINYVGLTTDHWTSRSNDAYMSLTCHFLTMDYKLKDYCLSVSHSPESHTGENISKAIVSEVKNWMPNMNKMKIYVVSDKASNMKAAARLLPENFYYLNCFAHTLQLVINDSIKKFPGTQNVIAKCKNITNHFSHSSQATHKLKEMQKTMGVPQQREPLSAILTSIPKVTNLSAYEWKTASEYVEALKPLENATTMLSSSTYSTISMIIPVLNTLIEQLQVCKLDSFGAVIINNIKTRWPNFETNRLYCLTTCIDPRFKLHAFSNWEFQVAAETLLTEELIKTTTQSQIENDSAVADNTETHVDENTVTEDAQNNQDFWASFRKKVLNRTKKNSIEKDITVVLRQEVKTFMDQPPIKLSECPFVWWNKNSKNYPHLAELARSLLFIPGTSVPSERIFSKCGLVLSDRRCRLKPNHAEMLVFLNHNLRH
ncbi:hypothetical protein SNE40_013713 [Patella caerulea]|uniref:HAT C-terminal dimerisation domain-containing protein n=1 Tax=Patella caerulea TaxID=87958 RepID=A0AAN8JC49_PATCE